jgi:hypothetical protein
VSIRRRISIRAIRCRFSLSFSKNADDISVDFIDAAVVANALTSTLRLLDLHRQLLPSSSTNKQLLLLSRRITRIRTLFEKLSQRPPEEK